MDQSTRAIVPFGKLNGFKNVLQHQDKRLAKAVPRDRFFTSAVAA